MDNFFNRMSQLLTPEELTVFKNEYKKDTLQNAE